MHVINGIGSEAIVHFDTQGKTLHEVHFKHPIDSFILPNPHEVVILETRNNCITVLDLRTREQREIPHHFMFEESDQSSVMTFGETGMICVLEQGRYNDSRFKLTYYSSITTKSKPSSVF
jgi:fructose-1-phosphate kinase PfkB-like protein